MVAFFVWNELMKIRTSYHNTHTYFGRKPFVIQLVNDSKIVVKIRWKTLSWVCWDSTAFITHEILNQMGPERVWPRVLEHWSLILTNSRYIKVVFIFVFNDKLRKFWKNKIYNYKNVLTTSACFIIVRYN